MLQVTTLRIVIIIVIGTILFEALLYMNGLRDGIRLKKRRKRIGKESNIRYEKFMLIYVMVLSFLILLGLIALKYNIRGAE